jgi:hypothetical protein
MQKQYTDQDLLNRVRQLNSFVNFPSEFWLIGVRSDEDKFNQFDDKFYLFKGEKFIDSWKGTTNAGTDLLNPTNSRGEAVLKSDGIYYNSHTRRKHRGKVMAYCQNKPLPIHRDFDRDRKAEELGTAKLELVGINIHPSSYQAGNTIEKTLINGWSQGCQVFSTRSNFDKFMSLTTGQQTLTYCLLKEFTPTKDSVADNKPLVGTQDTLPAVNPPEVATPAVQINEPPPNASTIITETTTLPPQPPTGAITETTVVTESEQTNIVAAPEKENSTATAAKLTIGGFAVPTVLITIFGTIKSTIDAGFLSASQVGEMVLGFIQNNAKWFFAGIGLIIIGLLLKKAYRQITFFLQMYFAARKDMNNIEIKKN